jgi:homocysteine S-methyltransferase
MPHARGPFLEALHERVIVADAAMGSRLYELGMATGECSDQLNLTRPELVRQVHRENIDAGAELLEANAFSANRLKLAAFGLQDQVRPINHAAVALAREVAADRAYVAATVGPLPPRSGDIEELTDSDVADVFREQIIALVEAGPDLILLETFTDLDQLLIALAQAKALCDLPIVAQMSFPDGRHAPDGHDAADALAALRDTGADVVGTNCGQGVSKVLRAIEYVAPRVDAPLSAFPNAGLPENVHGRLLYLATPAYLADAAERLVDSGVSLIGGCCGTKATDIAAIVQRVGGREPVARKIVPRIVTKSIEPTALPPRPAPPFLRDLKARTAVLVELDPPRHASPRKLIDGAIALRDAGADAVTLGDSPLATLRMNSVIAADIVQRNAEIPAVAHLACRDRNLIGTQSLLLGAAALGVRHVLCITGDPAKLGENPDATSVYDLNSFKLVELVARLNQGRTLAGRELDKPTTFHVGVAFNPNVRNLDVETKRLKRKVERGADFVMTQATYDAKRMAEACDAARPLGVPVFAGVFPLLSSRHAEFLHNEFPGITMPDAVRRRMADSADPAAEGMAIARELIDAYRRCADGLYLVPPLNRYPIAVELLQYVHDQEASKR